MNQNRRLILQADLVENTV